MINDISYADYILFHEEQMVENDSTIIYSFVIYHLVKRKLKFASV
jgi:hypothetical protein